MSAGRGGAVAEWKNHFMLPVPLSAAAVYDRTGNYEGFLLVTIFRMAASSVALATLPSRPWPRVRGTKRAVSRYLRSNPSRNGEHDKRAR